MNNQEWVNQIKKRAVKVPVRSGKSSKNGRVSFNDLVFVPAQLDRRPVDYYQEEIETETVFGRKSQKRFNISVPIIIGAMSFGALSKEAKTALAKASSLAGIVANTGEGGSLEEERKFADKLIVQYSTGRFGINQEVLERGDAIEIKIGQGAKPGSGGFLSKDKITSEIAQIRNVSGQEDIHSPAYHQDIKNQEDLKKKINWLREVSSGVPIIVKLSAGNIEKDIEIVASAQPDIIALDGMEGGTGAAPEVMLDEVGLPTMPALVRARRKLDDLNSDCELWIGGAFNKGGDIAKALALGADGVFMAFPFLISMGCVYCQQCHLGRCPGGIATQDQELRKNFNIEEAAEKAATFVNTCKEEIKMITGAVGKKKAQDLSPDDLRALNSETAEITRVKTVWE
jgi:methylamine---glutamate N-methyltransferase subunit C